MNDKCKYCDYVSKCSRACEYNSILCKINRSFPKVVEKSYEEILQENKQLKSQLHQKEEVINDLKFKLEYEKENLKFSKDYADCLKNKLLKAAKQALFIDKQLKKYVTPIPSKEVADLLDILKIEEITNE